MEIINNERNIETMADDNKKCGTDKVNYFLHSQRIYEYYTSNVEGKTMCYDGEKIRFKNVAIPNGIIKMYMEVINNVHDNVRRTVKNKIIPTDVNIRVEKTTVTVRNHGTVIPISKNNDGKWLPETIFSINGHEYIEHDFGTGVKLTNMLSSVFTVKIKEGDVLYSQTWKNNARECENPVIITAKKYESEKNYVEVSYQPDFKYFNITELSKDMIGVHEAYGITLSYVSNFNGCTEVPVVFNGNRYAMDNIQTYSSRFYHEKGEIPCYITEIEMDYQLNVVDNPNNGSFLSFVNGTHTKEGGVHEDALYDILINNVNEIIKKSGKDHKVDTTWVKNNMSVIINIYADGPKFKTSDREYLLSPAYKISICDDYLDRMKNWRCVKSIIE